MISRANQFKGPTLPRATAAQRHRRRRQWDRSPVRSRFRPSLRDDPSVAVVLFTTGPGDSVAAGAVGNRSEDVVGLSNLFTVSAEPEAVWAGATAALSARFPGLPLVGYERGPDLAAAHRAGFESVGQLRVWHKA